MLRMIAGAVIGFIVVALLVSLGFWWAYSALGSERVFEPGVYETTLTWNASTIGIGLVAAVIAGAIARFVGRRRGVLALAAVIAVLGAAEGLVLTKYRSPAPAERPESVTMREATENARQPGWMLVANPVIGVGGSLFGGGLLPVPIRGRKTKRATHDAPPA